MGVKIAFIHVKYPAGGAEKVTADLAGYLTRRGYGVHMFVEDLQSELLNEAEKRDITFIDAAFWGKGSQKNGLERIVAEINRRGIDIVVVPDYGVDDLSYIRQHTHARIVYALHSTPLWETWGYFSSKTRQISGTRSIGKMAEWFLLRAPHEFFTRRRRNEMVERYRNIYLNSDLFTVLVEGYKERLIKIFGPGTATATNNHIEAIANWIPPHNDSDRDGEHGYNVDRKKRILFMGRLDYASKRVDRLLDIWGAVCRDFPDWELRIVGDGPDRERFVRHARRRRLPHVDFRGYTTDPATEFREASIVCLTSSYEGWGLVISEAQQAGAVPVAFDVSAGVHAQIAPSGVNGFLIPPFDKRKFALTLALLMSDQALRREIGRNAIAKAREYSDESRLAKWDTAFRKLLTHPART
jgi:glycosyltransferase involved in cell wall biosynthesis